MLDELAPLKENFPEITTDEDQHPMTECALFADNIKALGYSWQSPWHFIDQPVYDQGNTGFPFEMPAEDLVGALTNLTDWLAYKGTDY